VAPDRRARRTRLGLLLAVAAPALVAAGAVVLTERVDVARVDHSRSPATLARLAGLPTEEAAQATPLRPLAARAGEAELGAERLESPAGGIRPAPPARIAIPAAGVAAPVQPVASVDDALEVPSVRSAGWFDGGARPGEPGRAVVIGHLDTRDGPGLFARVPNLPPGTRITVTDRRGQVHPFRVVGGSQVKKKEFPAAYVYGHSDRPVLVLITCGGPYAKGEGYRDNVLLYARAA
jgi:Sortase domain